MRSSPWVRAASPCVSAFMGDQFLAGQTRLYQKAFGAFYFSVNFGSFFAFLTIPYLARTVGYGWAFQGSRHPHGDCHLDFLAGNAACPVPPARETHGWTTFGFHGGVEEPSSRAGFLGRRPVFGGDFRRAFRSRQC